MRRTLQVLRMARDERSRWPTLDGIRGLAIVGVFAYHAFKLTGGWTSGKIRAQGVDWWWWPLGGGRLGVDLFFVLSGFLLLFSWRGIRRRNATLPGALREYARGRALRILPPYYLVLLVFVPFLAPELLRTARGAWDLFLFVTVQQYNEPALPARVNVVLWALTVEVQFYVVLPILAFFMVRRRRTGALLATLALSLWWAQHRGMYPGSFIFGRAEQFTAGMVLASLVADHLEGHTGPVMRLVRLQATAWFLAAAAATITVFHGSTLGLPHRSWARLDDWVHPTLAVVLAAILAHLVVSEHPGAVHGLLARPSLRLLGHLSYAVYLWHFPILRWVLGWSGAADHGLASPAAIPALALATILTIAVSAVTYAWVERPFLERKTRSSLVGPRQPAPPAAIAKAG